MRNWFKNISWERAVQVNEAACQKGGAQHGISESRGPGMEKLWRENAEKPMSLWAMVALCKRIHEGAPFHNFNGNTFAALAVEATSQIDCPDRFLLEDAVCNAVAGIIGAKSEENLRKFSEKLESQINPPEMG